MKFIKTLLTQFLKSIHNLKYFIRIKLEDSTYEKEVKKYKKKYKDYVDDEYNCGNLKFMWGWNLSNKLCNCNSNLYTMNDIDISYDRDNNMYYLGIETAYVFKDKQSECNYLKQLLECFTQYMNDNDYCHEHEYNLFMNDLQPKLSAESIEKLYTNFRIIVDGFCSVYGNKGS